MTTDELEIELLAVVQKRAEAVVKRLETAHYFNSDMRPFIRDMSDGIKDCLLLKVIMRDVKLKKERLENQT